MENSLPPSYYQSQTSLPQNLPYPSQPTLIGYDQQPPTYSAANYATQYSQKPAPFANPVHIQSSFTLAQTSADNPAFEGSLANVVVLTTPH